jgi:hypothetical protein
MAVGRRLPMPLVTEAYVIQNEKQLVQGRLILPTICLVFFSLEGNVAPKYLFLNSGAQDKFLDENLTYFHQRGITKFISSINKTNMSWEGVISAPPYTSFLCHVAV